MKSVHPRFEILNIVREDLNWSRFRWNSPKAEERVEKLRTSGYIILDEDAFFLEVKSSLDEYNNSLKEIEVSPENTIPIPKECKILHHEHVELPPSFIRRLHTNEIQVVIRDEYCPICNCVWTSE